MGVLACRPKDIYGPIAGAILATLIGSIVGTLLIKKITLKIIKLLIGTMLIIVGIGIISGLI